MDMLVSLLSVKECIDKIKVPNASETPRSHNELPSEIKSIIFKKFKEKHLHEHYGNVRSKQPGLSPYAKRRRAKMLGVCHKCGRTNCDGVFRQLQGSTRPCDGGFGIMSSKRAAKLEEIRYGRVTS
uniref:RNA silencing suppressor n=1 Tax=Hemp virus T TaxID=3064295 RepID=A0AA49X3U7_9VIRU|nr:MAG: nucleic acid-binding protein [Hemp virus T]